MRFTQGLLIVPSWWEGASLARRDAAFHSIPGDSRMSLRFGFRGIVISARPKETIPSEVVDAIEQAIEATPEPPAEDRERLIESLRCKIDELEMKVRELSPPDDPKGQLYDLYLYAFTSEVIGRLIDIGEPVRETPHDRLILVAYAIAAQDANGSVPVNSFDEGPSPIPRVRTFGEFFIEIERLLREPA